MQKPLISIIIPIYNQELYLRTCIESVLAQTYENWECVLVNDGSTDTSGQICDEYAILDSRIRVVHKRNEGSSAARQIGLEQISGKYVVFIDSDDWVEPTHLANMLSIAELEQAEVVICPYYLNKGGEQVLIDCRPSSLDMLTLQREVLEGVYHAGVVLKMFSHELFTKYHIPPAPYNYYEDMYMYISSLQYAKHVTFLPIATYHYRYNESSMTNDCSMNKRICMYEDCMRNLEEIVRRYKYNEQPSLMNAIYICSNHEKGRLLSFWKEYHKIKPYLLKYFPLSYAIIPNDTIQNRGLRAAFSGHVLPYFFYKCFLKYKKICKKI